jgi:uncharacterized membrane protein
MGVVTVTSRVFVRIACIGALALFVSRPAAAQNDRPSTAPLTLDEAISYALKNNRDVASSSHAVASAVDAVANARVRRLPSFELSSMTGQSITEVGVDFPAGAFGTFAGIGPVPSVDTRVTSPRRPVMFAQASLTQPISQLHRINLNVKATSIAVITVAATVIALIPLAMHGGPLWYAQIGGLTVATFVTLVIVPVIYAIFVKDLKLVKWDTKKEDHVTTQNSKLENQKEALAV